MKKATTVTLEIPRLHIDTGMAVKLYDVVATLITIQ